MYAVPKRSVEASCPPGQESPISVFQDSPILRCFVEGIEGIDGVLEWMVGQARRPLAVSRRSGDWESLEFVMVRESKTRSREPVDGSFPWGEATTWQISKQQTPSIAFDS